MVIGGSGFIGSRLVGRMLNKPEYSLKILDKNPSKTHRDLCQIVDVRSEEQLVSQIHNGSVIINLAAEHQDNVRPASLYDEVNINGAINICAAARKKNVAKIIFTSSVAVYGFAPPNASESSDILPFNDYGKTKHCAEEIFKSWQLEAPYERSLVIVRPTVVFGEQNRGNVYNLMQQIASGKFIMIGKGQNRKSIAYVENVAAFIEYCLDFKQGIHTFNYVDKPDFTMYQLVGRVKSLLGQQNQTTLRVPYSIAFFFGKILDLISWLTHKKYKISSIRIKKFCTDSVFSTAVESTGFTPPVPLEEALERTVRYEFMNTNPSEVLFYTE